jgi:hypothetical protein
VTVNPQPKLTFSGGTPLVGAGLQQPCCHVLLEAPAPVGGVTVRLESSNPIAILLSPDLTTPGTSTINLFIPAGSYYASFYIQGVETTSGPSTVTITASAPGYISDSMTATVVQPALQILRLPISTTTLSPDTPFYMYVGIPSGDGVNAQEVRAGGTALVATVTNSNGTVAQLVTATTAGNSVTALVPVGQDRSPDTVAAGGVAFDPLTSGTTAVNATIPGFISTTLGTVTVSP